MLPYELQSFPDAACFDEWDGYACILYNTVNNLYMYKNIYVCISYSHHTSSTLHDTVLSRTIFVCVFCIVRSVSWLSWHFPLCITDFLNAAKVQLQTALMTLFYHLHPARELPFGEFYYSHDVFVSAIFHQVDKAFVNTPILLPLQVAILKYTVEGLTKHVCVYTQAAAIAIAPSCYVRYPTHIKILSKWLCCVRVVQTFTERL